MRRVHSPVRTGGRHPGILDLLGRERGRYHFRSRAGFRRGALRRRLYAFRQLPPTERLPIYQHRQLRSIRNEAGVRARARRWPWLQPGAGQDGDAKQHLWNLAGGRFRGRWQYRRKVQRWLGQPHPSGGQRLVAGRSRLQRNRQLHRALEPHGVLRRSPGGLLGLRFQRALRPHGYAFHAAKPDRNVGQPSDGRAESLDHDRRGRRAGTLCSRATHGHELFELG